MAQLDLFAKTFIDDTTALHNWVQGDENTVVDVAGGSLDSPRKLIKQWNAAVNVSADGVLAQAVAARNAAQQSANDAAQTLVGAVKKVELVTNDGTSGIGFRPSEVSQPLFTRTLRDKLQETRSVKDWGAFGDGLSHPLSSKFSTLAMAQLAYPHATSLDDEFDWAALQGLINFAGGKFRIEVPCGVYLINRKLKATKALTHVCGAVNAYVYGISPGATILRCTGFAAGDTRKVFFDTYVNTTDFDNGLSNAAYITIENLAIDGNGLALVGYDGGFLTTHRGVAIVGCTPTGGIGYRVGLGQTSVHTQVAYNGNYIGYQNLDARTTTMQFYDAAFRQNTTYGWNGILNASTLRNVIFESNGSHGMNWTGGCNYGRLSTCYFEQNDAAQGSNGHNLRVAITGTSESNVLDGVIFGSTGSTKIARVIAGSRIKFRHCSQEGPKVAPQMTIDDGAEVIIEESFPQSPLPLNVKMSPAIKVNTESALRIGAGQLVINAPAMIFGSGDFAVSAVVEPNNSGVAIRDIIYGNAGAFQMLMNGSTSALGTISFFKVGAAAFASTNVSLKLGTPTHIIYRRAAGVGFVYVNGIQIDTFPDANNYTTTEAVIGNGTLNSNLYAFSTWVGSAPSAAGIFELWRYGGNATAAGLAPTMDLDFTVRTPGKVINRAATAYPYALPMTGDMGWTSPKLSDPWQKPPTSISGTMDLSAVAGEGWRADVAGNITSILFPANPADRQLLEIQLTNTGAFTLAGWPAVVLLAGGVFTLTATANKTDTLSFRYRRDISRWIETSRSQNC